MAPHIHSFSPDDFQDICDALAATDTDLTAIIDAHGYPPMWNRPNTFETLIHIILEQQVSLASALAALNKLRTKLESVVTPEGLLKLTDEELKGCYFSRQKTTYARHLARALQSGELDLHALEKLSDDEVRTRLTALKGIGDWTVDIYLIFVLQRADIFPLGDLAAVNALKRIKKIPKDTKRDELLTMIANWQPHRTIATMLMWHYYLSAPRQTKTRRAKQ
jgi:DNA-3-methyladenine glycosylase II